MSSAKSVYRRPLPEGVVAFASERGRVLFREALERGGMEGYFRLAEQLHTQNEPAFCGLGSLVVVLNALAIDPGRTWKGPWRWYSEEMLDCCIPLDRIKERGVTLGQLACLARCAGAETELHRADAEGVDAFRSHLVRSSSSQEGPFVVASYSRAALGQTGEGHFSPIGGYHAGLDAVLVLDVARFKYPPHWVPLTELHAAMQAVDSETGKSRGWLVFSRDGDLGRADCFGVDVPNRPWSEIVLMLAEEIPAKLAELGPASIDEALRAILVAAAPLEKLVASRMTLDALDPEERGAFDAVLDGLRASPIYERMGGRSDPLAATMLVLALPEGVFDRLPPPLRSELASLRDPSSLSGPAREELGRLRDRIAMLRFLADAD